MRYSLDDISISGSEDSSKKHLLSECKALFVTNILVLLGNFLCFIAIAVIIPSWRSSETSSHSALNYFPLQILSPSPAQEALQYELRRFTALGESEWDKPAGDKTDASWDALIDNGKWFAIDQKTFEEINGNPTTGLRIPGDSQGRFYGILQVHHQLHCVDILRRGSWFIIDHYRDKGHVTNMTDREIIRHMRHCTEILRQTI
ncbi:unnamed protein product [Clonostachys rosea f. rosea IK726]|uniref:Uncharacterized protein n=1 Tax=Clonostachys rosea f. rosea IK726 TaxID=1349383 RepID=A0ACA9UK17_BIOOC|nr:unnamed protein product [Clonostachys rosea f. rosea IK726]